MDTSTGLRWMRLPLILLALVGIGIGGWYAVARGKSTSAATDSAAHDRPDQSTVIAVDVMHPQAGGIQRICSQPGTVEPYEAADLYAKVSGFLTEQKVDIGSRVQKDEILARISVPEDEKQVEKDRASVKNAEAVVHQMAAHVTAAKAEAKAADVSVVYATVLVRAKTSYRQYREKQRNRFTELSKANAIEARVVDEQEDYYMSALEAENAAREGVNKAQEQATAAKAKITQAEADLEEAKSKIEVAKAQLEKDQEILKYTVIRSPYTGVVTKRSFHLGDFIKSADQGGIVPLLAIERTDLMRVVVQVPDRDVPYVSTGSTASIEIDALPGKVFNKRGKDNLTVSRWSDAEDPTTRTMRTEVDIPNPTDAGHPYGILSHGMYGRATLILGKGTPNALRIPSSALVGKAEGGRGSVRVVRDGKVRIVPVRFATDSGVEVEIVAGLTANDRVITRATGTIEDGTPVVVHDDKSAH
jgi:HlyD family secretion protein